MRLTKGDHRYEESGLSHVVLTDMDFYQCPKCGETMPVFSSLEQLHQTIGKRLLEKTTLLTGEEIRFLRKEMGLSAVKLAEILGVSKVTVSRWETGQERIGSSVDRAIRLLYLLSQANDLDPIIGNLRQIGKRQRSERITISWRQSKQRKTMAA